MEKQPVTSTPLQVKAEEYSPPSPQSVAAVERIQVQIITSSHWPLVQRQSSISASPTVTCQPTLLELLSTSLPPSEILFSDDVVDSVDDNGIPAWVTDDGQFQYHNVDSSLIELAMLYWVCPYGHSAIFCIALLLLIIVRLLCYCINRRQAIWVSRTTIIVGSTCVHGALFAYFACDITIPSSLRIHQFMKVFFFMLCVYSTCFSSRPLFFQIFFKLGTTTQIFSFLQKQMFSGIS